MCLQQMRSCASQILTLGFGSSLFPDHHWRICWSLLEFSVILNNSKQIKKYLNCASFLQILPYSPTVVLHNARPFDIVR